MQAYCHVCIEKRECRWFEIVNRFGLRLAPFCRRCVREVGKQWSNGKEKEAIGPDAPSLTF